MGHFLFGMLANFVASRCGVVDGALAYKTYGPGTQSPEKCQETKTKENLKKKKKIQRLSLAVFWQNSYSSHQYVLIQTKELALHSFY